jgi:hypothetical protein
MIRSLIAFFFVVFIFHSGNGQSFKGALKAGITTSQVSGDALSGFHKAGIAAGGLVKRELSEKISYQFEMLYIQKGSRKSVDPDNNDYTFFLLKLNYIEIPISLQYKKGKFIYDAGVAFGRLIHSSVENEAGLYPRLHPESRAFYKEEYSVQIGVSYPLYNKLYMNWRISNSILPIRNHQGNAVYQFNRGQYSTVLQFTFNYFIEPAAKAKEGENG